MDRRSESTVGSEKVISEVYGKELLHRLVLRQDGRVKCVTVNGQTNWDDLEEQNPWLKNEAGLVVKPDQSIKRRKQLGLIKLNVDYQTAKHWIQERLGTKIEVDGVEGNLKQFLIEPFLPHEQNEEFYLCIYAHTVSQDVVLFHHEGGVDVGNIDEKGLRLHLGLKEATTDQSVQDALLKDVANSKKQMLSSFIRSLVECFRDLHFTYLELNPLVVTDTAIHILDVAAKLDAKAAPLCKEKWGQVQFAPALSRELHPQEQKIVNLQAGTPCSMNLTILNKAGRIWTLIFGGGTSLVIGDTAAELGVLTELACYTQISGKPTADQLYEFSKTLIDLMMEEPHPKGKTLIISCAVADILMMAKFKIGAVMGMVKALQESQEKLEPNKISLVVRRNTVARKPNSAIPPVLTDLGIPVQIVPIDIPITQVIQGILGLNEIQSDVDMSKNFSTSQKPKETSGTEEDQAVNSSNSQDLFNGETRVIVAGLMSQAVQSMLDYDFVCGRQTPSVAALVNPGSGDDKEESFLWHEGQVGIPVYSSIETALKNHPDASMLVNAAFGMDAFHIALAALKFKPIRCILMIVGHIPEQQTRTLIMMAKNNEVLMIGPCVPSHLFQVNMIKPGSFRCNKFGNTCGTLDNVLDLKLYRPGSVGLVTCSGGLLMELIANIAKTTDGLYQGVSLGGGKYTGSSFVDHLIFLENSPEVKILLLLGEFGGREEFEVCDAIRSGKITKPIIAYCIGACANMIKNEPGYFGHCGAGYDVTTETASAKNKALAEAGAVVPASYDDIPNKLAEVYTRLVSEGQLVPKQEGPVPSIPANMRPMKGKKK